MYKDLRKISTVGMSRDTWLEHRRKSIGGSDAAAVVGLNPWSTPYSVWADKLGKLPEKEDTEAMRQGRDLEDYVAKRFSEATGKRVRRENNIIINPDYPYAHANVDRLIIGEDAGLECKTTSTLNLKKFATGEFLDTYYVQCMHYMMITGAKKWYLAVLVFGKGFYHFEIYRDEAEIEALAKAEEGFWHSIQTEIPPMTDGERATTEAVSALYAVSNDTAIDLSGYESDLKQYMTIKEQIKQLENIKDSLENNIKSFMRDAGRGESSGYKVSWTSSERRTFDSKRFAAEHNGVDLSKYYKITNTRTFRVSEKEAI